MTVSNGTLNAFAPEWCIAIFARNEEARIADCLLAIKTSTTGVRAHTIVIINGNSDKTAEVALTQVSKLGLAATVYVVPIACKSHAMNLFIHELRSNAEVCFFVDATVFVEPDALRALAEGLTKRPDLLAVSGLPVNGRGAKKMIEAAAKSGRLFGQLFAIRKNFLDELVARERKLPIGLYRGDGLFSGFLCWETDGVAHERPMPRIANIPEARWRIRPISWFKWKDIKAGFNRLVRQGRGRLENQAWNPILWTQGFGALPRYADDMILEWLKTNRPAKEPIPARFFTMLALRRVRRWRRPDEETLRPRQIPCTGPLFDTTSL